MDPLDQPGPPVSCVALQPLNTSIELTTSAVDGIIDDPVLETVDFTVMAIEVTQAAPFGPQALTCSVCAPLEAEIDLSMD